MRLLSRGLTSSLLLLASAAAATAPPITDTAMAALLAGDGADLALAAAPMWLFIEALWQVPCYPTHATDADGQQTPSAALCSYPNTGCNCRNHAEPPFPVYYSVSRCDLAEVRVAYNIFFEKNGSARRWQRYCRRREEQRQVGAHPHAARPDAGRPRGGTNGRTGREHPKVYVSWSKHAAYHTRRTGWIDPLSQLTWNAYCGDYLQADASTPLGATIAGFDWGHADSFPARVHEKPCEV
ncbi:hypothetical protein B0T24DRAFT_672132 [Lasiosphaeria ovina]|uniref:Uncharacterized protein n=1 Tax=Lasiosphaeria ovina TaxID=92902 RepID=A0AAE0TWM3_9PEZI|nr:hypothetical protein B0T24DRAFT_672132 [Lasiosphaeria ovina]